MLMFLNVVSFVFVHLAVSNANRRQSSIAFIHGTGALDSSIKMTENIMHSPSKHHTHTNTCWAKSTNVRFHIVIWFLSSHMWTFSELVTLTW